jgi:predicted permease
VATLTPYSLRETIVGRAAGELWLFAGAVLLLLLVAVVNVATLVLVRTVAREHELAVRAALGATRARLARLVVVEGLLLAGTSGLLGLGIAAAALRLVPHIAPGLPRSSEVALAGTPVLAALLLTVLTGLAIGISPFLLVGRARPIQGSVRRGDPGGKAGLVRRILVAAEFSLVVPLLLAAALLGRSLMELQQVDPGYDAKSTLSVRFSLPQGRYRTPAEAQQFWDRAIRQALETPGIAAAGVGTGSPPDDPGDVNNFNLVAHPVSPGSPEPTSPWTAVTPGYFEALRIPLLEGRMFGPGDSASAPPVAIVSRAWAARYFPGEEVVGQQLIGGGCYQCPRTTIVGVVGDVKYQGLAGNGDGVYTPLQQEEITAATLFVRARGAPAGITRSLTERLAALDPTLPLAPETLAARLRRVFADPGRWTAVVASFAGAALLLAAMGIAGLLSYVVRRQRREIGVRMALGAKPGAVIRMVILRGMGSAVPGSLVGLALALAGARGVASMLYGVGPRDPETALGVVALLLGIALMASLVPALRAVRIRPIEALADD